MPRKQCRRCSECQPCDVPHGTSSGYDYHRCRCTDCKAHANARIADYRSRNLAKCRAWARTSAANWDRANPEYGRTYKSENREYIRDYSRRRYADNRDYILSQGKRRDALEAAIPHPRKGIPYSNDEDAIVADHTLSTREAAYLLGRSVNSVRSRRSHLLHPAPGRFEMACHTCGQSFHARQKNARWCSRQCLIRGRSAPRPA